MYVVDTNAAHASTHGRRFRGFRRFFALLLLMPMIVLATSSSAGAVIVAGFEIDGDTPVNEGGLDWETTGSHVTDPFGNDDTTTFKGSKEFEHPNTWVQGTGLAPNQDDVTDVYFYDQVVNGDTWFYLGFRRLTTTGVTNYDVEFNQLENSGSNSFEPIRTVGDLMVRFEQDGNKGFKLTLAYLWTEVDSADWAAGCIEVPGYDPRSGWCPTSVADSGFVGATGEAGHFAEGAFNLSSFFDGETCRPALGTMNIRSFTGNANESALKDYINPIPIGIEGSCGSLQIFKKDQFGRAVPGATFTIDPNPIPGEEGILTVTDGGLNDPDGDADGEITINPATPGTYTVVETAAPPGYELPPLADRTFTVTVGENGQGSEGLPVQVEDRLFFDAPTILNTPTATYDIDYNWLVSKAVVGPTTQNVPQGSSATFNYEVRLEALEPTRTGYELGGTLTVNNPNADAMEVTLATRITGGAACVITATDVDELTAGLQVDLVSGANPFTYTCPLGANPPDGSTTATVAWDEEIYPQDGAVDNPAEDESPYTFAIDEETDLTTDVTDTFNGGEPVDLGTYNWNEVYGSEDPAPHTITVASYTGDPIVGEPGECRTYPNTAVESADGTQDTEIVTVCVEKALTLTATTTADLARAFAWSIQKAVDATTRTVDTSGNATFRYTVTARAGASTDSGWQMSGSVTLTNDNRYPESAITADVTATTTVGGGTTCAVTGGNDAVVPAGDEEGPGTLTLPITCIVPSQPASTGQLDVTAIWDPAGEATSASTNTSAPVAFGVRSETNKVVDVVDDKTVPGQRIVLETGLTWSAGLVKTYTYDLAVAGGAAGACATYTNTAKVDQPVGTDPTASTTVTACRPAPPEVLPEQSFGKAVGSVKASCQGTVRTRLNNRSGDSVTYKLRVGTKVHRIVVKSLSKKRFTTTGKALAKVTLKLGTRTLDKVRIPNLCASPEVLPDTGLRGT